MLLLLPIPIPAGTLYLAEPVLYAAAANTAVRQRFKARFPHFALGATVAVVLAVMVAVLVGRHGGLGHAQHQFRAVIVLTAGIIAVSNTRRPPALLIRLVADVACGLAILLAVERVTGLVWDHSKLFATVDRSYRVSGPLGPGHTASILLAGLYVTVRTRRTLATGLILAGMLLVASRAHLIGTAVMLSWAFLAGRLTRRQIVSLFATGLAAWALVPSGVARLLDAATGTERNRSRLVVWEAVFDQTSWADFWVGLGPGGFSIELSSIATASFAHSQYLTAWVDWGVIGIAGLVVVVAGLWHRSTRTGTRPLVVGWLTAAIFGEFVYGPTVPGNLGALACWTVALTPVVTARAFGRAVVQGTTWSEPERVSRVPVPSGCPAAWLRGHA